MNQDLNIHNRNTYDLCDPLPGSILDLNVAIVGFGSIGKTVGTALSVLGANVHGYATRRYQYNGITVSPLDSFCRDASKFDCVISLLPQHSSLISFFGDELFKSLKAKCILINNGRSSHVDELALRPYILNKSIRFASDTIDNTSMFVDLYNKGYDVLTSPHIAAVGPNYWPKQIDLFSKLLDDFLDQHSL